MAADLSEATVKVAKHLRKDDSEGVRQVESDLLRQLKQVARDADRGKDQLDMKQLLSEMKVCYTFTVAF